MKKLEVENLVGLSLAIHSNLFPLPLATQLCCLSVFLSRFLSSLSLYTLFFLFISLLSFLFFFVSSFLSLSLCLLYLYPFFSLFLCILFFLSLSLFISLLYFLSFSLSSLSLPHFKSLKLLKLIFNFPSTHFSNFCTGRTQLKLYIQ